MSRLKTSDLTLSAGSERWGGYSGLETEQPLAEWEPVNEKNLIQDERDSKADKVQGLLIKFKSSFKGLGLPRGGGSDVKAGNEAKFAATSVREGSPTVADACLDHAMPSPEHYTGESKVQKGKVGFKMNTFSLPTFAAAMGAELRGYDVMAWDPAVAASSKGHAEYSYGTEKHSGYTDRNVKDTVATSLGSSESVARSSYGTHVEFALDNDAGSEGETLERSGKERGSGFRLSKLKLPSLRRVAEATADKLRGGGGSDGMNAQLSVKVKAEMTRTPPETRNTLRAKLQGFRRSSSASSNSRSEGASAWSDLGYGQMSPSTAGEESYGYDDDNFTNARRRLP